jgi:hypothetical protein
MASADFTVQAQAVPPEYAGSYDETIDLELVSTSGVRTVTWSIVGVSRAGLASPAITSAGSPSGATASFDIGSTPGDSIGISYLVQCQVNGGRDDEGVEDSNLTKRAVIGVANSGGIVPVPLGETFERDAEVGWTEVFNDALNQSASVGGGGGGGHGFRYTFSTTTADADPGAGTFRANNATLSSATQLYVDLAEYGGTDVTDWLDQIDDYAGAIKGVIRLRSLSDETKWIEYTVTEWTTAAGYRKLTVAYKDGPGGILTTAGDTFLSFDYATSIVAGDSTVTVSAAGAVARAAISGDITIAGGSNTAAIATGAVVNADVNSAAGIELSKLEAAITEGTDLTDADQTLSIADGTRRSMAASTTSTARTKTLGTGGTPETDEVFEIIVYSQGHNVLIVNGGPLAGTLYTVVAGTKRVCQAMWNGTDWAPAGKARLT